MFFTKCILSFLALHASYSFATPTSENKTEHDVGLEKRYNFALNFANTVSTADQATIMNAFQDMQLLARAAANYDFSNTAGNVDGIYRRYFPQGSERQVQAMFRFLAGIPQLWGVTQLTFPDFSRITFNKVGLSGTNQAYTNSLAGATCWITFTNLGFPPFVKGTVGDLNFRGTQTSVKMETVGAILMHELLHCTSVITSPIMDFGGPNAANPQPNRIIDDQMQSLIGIPEKSYGAYLSAQLKQNNAPLALLNNDNYMYFALEAYWRGSNVPTSGFNPPDRECLDGCTAVFRGYCLWCFYR